MEKMGRGEFESVKHHTMKHMRFSVLDVVFCGEHLHSDMEIIQVLVGSLHVRSRSGEYDMEVGDVALFNSNDVHSLRSNQPMPCTLLALQIDPAFCSSYFPQIYNLHFLHSDLQKVLPIHILEDVQGTCFDIGYNYFGQLPGFSFRCISDLNRLMGIFVVFVPYEILSEDDWLSRTGADNRARRILNYIHQHYKEKITLKEIACQEHLSPTYLSHMLKALLGQSFQKYVNQLRFEHAVFLLQTTQRKIIDICNESGFSDSKYLNKVFLEVFGLTPKAYRDMYLEREQEPKPEEGSGEREPEPDGGSGEREGWKNLVTYSQKESIAILRANHKFLCDENLHFSRIRISPQGADMIHDSRITRRKSDEKQSVCTGILHDPHLSERPDRRAEVFL